MTNQIFFFFENDKPKFVKLENDKPKKVLKIVAEKSILCEPKLAERERSRQ